MQHIDQLMLMHELFVCWRFYHYGDSAAAERQRYLYLSNFFLHESSPSAADTSVGLMLAHGTLQIVSDRSYLLFGGEV